MVRIRLAMVVSVVTSGAVARAEPSPMLDVGLVGDASRYDAGDITSGNHGLGGHGDLVVGAALRTRVGLVLDRRYGAFVRASVSTTRDATLVANDALGLPFASGTTFRVWSAGVGAEALLDDRVSIAPWLGAVRVDLFDGDEHDTAFGFGMDAGVDVVRSGVHRVAVTAGALHASGLTTLLLGLAYRAW